jgi:hypothetical protein
VRGGRTLDFSCRARAWLEGRPTRHLKQKIPQGLPSLGEHQVPGFEPGEALATEQATMVPMSDPTSRAVAKAPDAGVGWLAAARIGSAPKR